MSKATDLPSFAWRDPAYVCERLEEMTCAGCVHKETVTAFGKTLTVCSKRKNYDGIRCSKYKEKKKT